MFLKGIVPPMPTISLTYLLFSSSFNSFTNIVTYF